MYETTDAVHSHPAVVSPVGPASPKAVTGNGSQTKAAATVRGAQEQPQLKGARFQNLAKLNTQFNHISESIGKVSRAMDQIEARMVKMSDKLFAFRKIFPPYPPGSDERVKLFNSFSGLRKQIQQLTYPPEDQDAMAILAPAAADNASRGVLEIRFKAPGTDIAVLPQNLDLGPGGLNIPEMSPEVLDSEIDEILEKINQARQTLKTKRLGLLEDAQTLFAAKEKLGLANSASIDVDALIPKPLRGEADAEKMSQKLFAELTDQKRSIADDPMTFKPFLG